MAGQSMRRAGTGSQRSARPTPRRTKARRARPTISLCLIARDEAANLPRCLASVLGLVDEIVLVDTGSTDDTVAVARHFGARTAHFAWCDDFAAARNFSLKQATGEWIFYLDADEALDVRTAPNLRRLIDLPTSRPRAFLLPIRNHLGEGAQGPIVQHYAARLFQRHPRIRFHRPIHEDIVHLDGPEHLERVVSDDVTIDHFGYRQSVMNARAKEARNLNVLERVVATGSTDPYDHYLLARERYAFGKLEAAVEALEGMFRLVTNEDPGYLGEAYAIFVAALTGLDRPEVALAAAQRGLRRHPYTDLWYNTGNAYLAIGDDEAAISAFQAALARRSDPLPYTRDLSISAWRAWLGLGEAFRRRGDLESARTALTSALASAPFEREVVLTAAVVACLTNRAEEAITAIERYLIAHPGDDLLQRLLADARRCLPPSTEREPDPCRR